MTQLGERISVELYRFLAQAFRTGRDELLQQLGCELFGFEVGGAYCTERRTSALSFCLLILRISSYYSYRFSGSA
jgi:hypothetical protein